MSLTSLSLGRQLGHQKHYCRLSACQWNNLLHHQIRSICDLHIHHITMEWCLGGPTTPNNIKLIAKMQHCRRHPSWPWLRPTDSPKLENDDDKHDGYSIFAILDLSESNCSGRKIVYRNLERGPTPQNPGQT